jgi:hypothetical protein
LNGAVFLLRLETYNVDINGMNKINRLRAMAQEALIEYQASLASGGEPVYPDWADDMLDVCEQAEAGFRIHHPPVHTAVPASLFS